MDINEIRESYEKLMEEFIFLKDEVRTHNRLLYERWKAGGFIVDEDVLCMYPNLGKVIEQIEKEEEENRRDEKRGLYPEHEDDAN